MITYQDVTKAFGDKPVLQGLDFQVARGEVYGLLGPNGSGKSTAINILCNLLDPDRGEVRVGGEKGRAAVRRLGVVSQEVALYRDLTCEENLRFFARLHGVPSAEARRRVAELMQLFQLDRFAGSNAGKLSGGWQRRLHIAVALVHSPEVLVLDEPTAAVDVEARHQLWGVIEALRASGATILLTTHHLDEVERLCTRVGVMREGRIAAEGSVGDLLKIVPAAQVAVVDASDEGPVRARAAALGWGWRRYAGRPGLLLPRPLALKAVVDALEGLGISSVTLQPVSLEHAYLEVARGGVEGDADVLSSAA